MILRVVKMTFKSKKVSDFIEHFNSNKTSISNFEGCRHLELWRDLHKQNVYWTYSKWESEQHLNAYRKSDLFKSVWSKTKLLFKSKPKAWSTTLIEEIPPHQSP